MVTFLHMQELIRQYKLYCLQDPILKKEKNFAIRGFPANIIALSMKPEKPLETIKFLRNL